MQKTAIWLIERLMSVRFEVAEIRDVASVSDHPWFWRVSYPPVMVTDTSTGTRTTAPSDAPEQPNFPVMARVVLGLQGAVAARAGISCPSSNSSAPQNTLPL